MKSLYILVAVCLACVHAEQKDKHHHNHHNKLLHHLTPQTGCLGGQSPLCCAAKDNNCRVYGSRMNNDNSTTCFCDSACMELRDCCLDYQEACKPVDCVLDEWAPYGACDTRCGWGIKQREKRILVEAANGGKPCQNNIEKLACYGYNCKTPRAHEGGLDELRETGKIIPAEYGSWRKDHLYNPFKGIRKNLFDRYSANEVITRPSYCSHYEITATRKSCNSTFFAAWAPELQKGRSICVECQPTAMKKSLGVRCRGHGVFMKETRWNAATIPGCHGEWIMKTRHEECSCKAETELSFILI